MMAGKGDATRGSQERYAKASVWCPVCGKMRGGMCKCVEEDGMQTMYALMEAVGYERREDGVWHYPDDPDHACWCKGEGGAYNCFDNWVECPRHTTEENER